MKPRRQLGTRTDLVVVGANMDGFQKHPGESMVHTESRFTNCKEPRKRTEADETKLGQPDGGTRKGNRGGVRRALGEGGRVLCG